MVKMVFLARRRADMEGQDFRRYWRETHAPIASNIPGLTKYVQSHFNPKEGVTPPYDGVAEMWFQDESAFETPEFEATIADTANFLDVEASPGFNVERVEVV